MKKPSQNSATKRKSSPTQRRLSKSPEKATPVKRKVKGKKIEPYIGDYDDPNLEEYVKDNPYLRTGFRICFHSYYDCVRSLFMIHNETMNVWSHLIGCLIFVCIAFYVLIFLKPTSLHESTSLVNRWSSGFDQGRFD